MLWLYNHGGLCCGRKHLASFPSSFNYKQPEIPLSPEERRARFGTNFNFMLAFYTKIETEPSINRLNRLLHTAKKSWPSVLIEATLVNRNWGQNEKGEFITEVEMWEPALLERGFKRVDSFQNSNSGAEVVIYHCCTGDIPEKVVLDYKDAAVPKQVKALRA